MSIIIIHLLQWVEANFLMQKVYISSYMAFVNKTYEYLRFKSIKIQLISLYIYTYIKKLLMNSG